MLRVCVGMEINLIHGRLDIGNLEELPQLLEVEVADTNAPIDTMGSKVRNTMRWIAYFVRPASLSFSNARQSRSVSLSNDG